MNLFLKGSGRIFVSARGGATGKVRFGGGTEPFVWGTFTLYRNKDGEEGKKYLQGVDVADDMLKLRGRADALFAAARWSKLLIRHLMAGHPSDDLLANLYWNMKLLSEGRVPVEVTEWRFLWRWLRAWGLAPHLSHWMEVNPRELELLRKTTAVRGSELNTLAAEDMKPLAAHRHLFLRAARRAEELLREL